VVVEKRVGMWWGCGREGGEERRRENKSVRGVCRRSGKSVRVKCGDVRVK